MENFKKILSFQSLLKEYNQIYRELKSIHNQMPDNDVEHSYRVAMLCWMILDEYDLKMDLSKVLRYALVHDLVEVYAGDTSIYSNIRKEEKDQKEHESLLKLKEKFPKLANIWQSIDDYEKREDDESKFVYIIEKIEPILVCILSEEDHWKKKKVNFKFLKNKKMNKIKNIESFAQLFANETMEYLNHNVDKYFIK